MNSIDRTKTNERQDFRERMQESVDTAVRRAECADRTDDEVKAIAVAAFLTFHAIGGVSSLRLFDAFLELDEKDSLTYFSDQGNFTLKYNEQSERWLVD